MEKGMNQEEEEEDEYQSSNEEEEEDDLWVHVQSVHANTNTNTISIIEWKEEGGENETLNRDEEEDKEEDKYQSLNRGREGGVNRGEQEEEEEYQTLNKEKRKWYRIDRSIEGRNRIQLFDRMIQS